MDFILRYCRVNVKGPGWYRASLRECPYSSVTHTEVGGGQGETVQENKSYEVCMFYGGMRKEMWQPVGRWGIWVKCIQEFYQF